MPDVVAALSAPSNYSPVFGTGNWNCQWLDPDFFSPCARMLVARAEVPWRYPIVATLAVLSHKNGKNSVSFAVITLAGVPETEDFCENQGLARCKSREEQRKTAGRPWLKLRSAA
jgi:hypothetical protein